MKSILAIITFFLALQVGKAERKGFMLQGRVDSPEAMITGIRDLEKLHAKIVRFPFYPYDNVSLDAYLDMVAQIAPVCAASNMVLVIVIHQGNHPNHVEVDPNFINWWQRISFVCKDYPLIWYDLANEPDEMNLAWPEIALKAATEIRLSDSNHCILYCPGGSTVKLASSSTPLPGIKNQMFTFHFWEWPGCQGSEGAPPYARYGNGSVRNFSAMKDKFEELAKLRSRSKIGIYLGEAGIYWRHPDAPTFLHDFTQLCDLYDFDATLHAYRESKQWDYAQDKIKDWPVIIDWLRK